MSEPKKTYGHWAVGFTTDDEVPIVVTVSNEENTVGIGMGADEAELMGRTLLALAAHQRGSAGESPTA